MKKINLLMLFMFIISVSNLISYEIKKDEIIKVKTLIMGKDADGKLIGNFPVKKEDENKFLAEILGIGLENFINQIGAENIIDIKTINHLAGHAFVVVYKEKKK
ncbi:hypothetical protein QIA36_05610 (plasmid) [Borreliella yangtzensis]|uniref:hypothetical protein n=1 Tax=Borreliella yangtzensis TaxID=683292 RepID=UPI003BA02ED1